MALRTDCVAPHTDGADGPAHCFFQSHHDDSFHVLAFLRLRLARGAAAAAKKLLEEIAEAGAAKFKIFRAGSAAPGMSAEGLTAGAGRRPGTSVLPIRPELVVLPALLGVTEHLIGFV